jgi:hypothetical protein
MNVARMLIAFVVVYIALILTNYLIHDVLLMGLYSQPEVMKIWRPDMMSKMWIMYLVDVFIAFFFAVIFTKGYEGRGWMEGVRYGFYIGCITALPAAYAQYASYPFPYSLALQWFIYGMIQYIVLGIVVALIYRPKAKAEA